MGIPHAKVFVTRRRVPEAIDLLGQHFDLEAWEPNSPPPPDVLLEKAAQSDALLTEADDKVHAGLLEAAPSLKVVANRGVGVDNIDIPAATRCGVLVGNTPGILQESCADFTFGLMIAAARRIVHADRQVQAGRWTKFDPMPYVGHDVHGKTLGIVGLGAIGGSRRPPSPGLRHDRPLLLQDPQSPGRGRPRRPLGPRPEAAGCARATSSPCMCPSTTRPVA